MAILAQELIRIAHVTPLVDITCQEPRETGNLEYSLGKPALQMEQIGDRRQIRKMDVYLGG